MCLLAVLSHMMLCVLKLWIEIRKVHCKRSRTGNACSVSPQVLFQWPHKYDYYKSFLTVWMMCLKMSWSKIPQCLELKRTTNSLLIQKLPTAPGLLRAITLNQGCCVRCLFLILSLHSILIPQQRTDYFYYSVFSQKCTLLHGTLFLFVFIFRATIVRFRHHWYGILCYWLNWLIVIPSALKSVGIYTNKAAKLIQNYRESYFISRFLCK